MKNLAILGSTGSIGTQTLDVVRSHPELFHVSVLAANRSDELFAKQVEEFRPELAVLADEAAYTRLKEHLAGKCEGTQLAGGRQSFIDAAAVDDVDIVVTSMMGFAGLEPTMKALDARKDIALANKETLVVAGELVTRRAKEQGVKILPVDSEHCAFFQCLQGERLDKIEKLLLTCSGGPFRGKQRADLEGATVDQVLAHPTWNMGKKITVDSASLVNKGLEVIEAKWLFDVEPDAIQVVIQPQSVIHSMVEFEDGSVIAQLGPSDMRIPIQYALTWPDRLPSPAVPLDFTALRKLDFGVPEDDTLLGLPLALRALRAGGSMPCAFNAANEWANAAFRKGTLSFPGIYEVIEQVMAHHQVLPAPSIPEILEIEEEVYAFCRGLRL